MNLLDPMLKVSNSAVVLACAKCFLKLSEALPDLQPQIHLRLKTPLLTSLAASSNEVAYPVLSHILLAVSRAAQFHVFEDEFKQFFCKVCLCSPPCAMRAARRYAPPLNFVFHISSPRISSTSFPPRRRSRAQYNEPTCVKSLKMAILPKIANASSAREIVAELAEYVGGVDADLARQAVLAIGEIGVRVPPAVDGGA